MGRHVIQKDKVNKTLSEIIALGSAGNAVKGLIYESSDNNAAGKRGVAFASENSELTWLVTGASNSDNIAMTLGPSGSISADVILAGSDNLLTGGANGLQVPTLKIASDSQNQLSYDAATNTIGFTSLAIKRTVIDDTHADLDAFIATNYPNGNEYQSGDLIYLTTATGGSQVWVNKIDEGMTASGDATDFIQLQKPDLDDAYILNLLSAGNAGISYNPSTGAISLVISGNTNNDMTLESDGAFVDVSEGHITDTHGFINPVIAAPDRTVQMLFDAIGGVAASAVQNFSISGDLGAGFTIDKTNNNFSIIGEADGVLKTTFDPYSATIGFNKDGAVSGQVLKLADDGNGGLKTIWGVDGAAGFTDTYVPFAAPDGTLTENSEFRLVNGGMKKRLLINANQKPSWTVDTDGIGLYAADGQGRESWKEDMAVQTNFYTFSGTHVQGPAEYWFTSKGSIEDFEPVADEQFLGYRAGRINTNSKSGGDAAPNWDNAYSYWARLKTYTDVNNYSVEQVWMQATTNNSSNGGAMVMKIDNTGDFLLANYVNTRNDYSVTNSVSNVSNLLFTDASGKFQSMGAGTANQVLKTVDDGNGTLSLQWATDTSNLSPNNGLNLDGVNIQLGGDIIEDTNVNITNAFELSFSGATVLERMTRTLYETRNSNNPGTKANIWKQENGIASWSANTLSTGGDYSTASVNFKLDFDAVNSTAIFTDSRASKVGIQYAGDYSDDFTDTTLITKKYADDLVGSAQSPLSFLNGLTESGNQVKLGGDVSEPTTLGLSTNNLTFTGTTGRIKAGVDVEFTNAAKGIILRAPDGHTRRVTMTNDGILEVSDPLS